MANGHARRAGVVPFEPAFHVTREASVVTLAIDDAAEA